MTRKDISIHELHVAKTSIFCLITDCASTADGSTSIVHELRDFFIRPSNKRFINHLYVRFGLMLQQSNLLSRSTLEIFFFKNTV